MPDEPKAKDRLEIAHVLFMDIVGYSKLLTDEQSEALQELNHIVRATEAVREAEATNQLIFLPTGDGMALVFTTSEEDPVECALEISEALRAQPSLPVRMGIHSGPVHHVADVNQRANVAGAGINIAQRVMDCGDAGHILVSKRVADDLAQSRRWRTYLHELGDFEVKHGVVISLVNVYADVVGNPEPPAKLGAKKKSAGRKSEHHPLVYLIPIAALVIPAVLFLPKILHEQNVPARRASAPNDPSAPEKSVAVLPFDNLSSEKENAYFAEGVQDEILTDLAKIADLKVISRTSVTQYKSDAPRNLREIGQQLGVAHLLEGSVQRAKDKVRVNAQLINARTDAHEWAENYDRPLDDVFAIQSDIAKAIADQLQAKIAPPQAASIERRPTNNLAAYDAYLRGQEAWDKGLVEPFRQQAIDHFREAVRLDPAFATAWARLSRALLISYFNSVDPAPSLKAGREAAEKASQLQPGSVDAILAQGYLAYYGEDDFDRAIALFQQAQKLAPNDTEILEALGLVLKRKGKWQESEAYFRQAEALNPRDPTLLRSEFYTLVHLRDDAQLRRLSDRLLELEPGDSWAVSLKVGTYYDTGDLDGARALLPTQVSADEQLAATQVQLLIFEKKFPQALAAVTVLAEKAKAASSISHIDYLETISRLQRWTGQTAASQQSAREILKEIAERYRESPTPWFASHMAAAYALLGDKAKAIAAAKGQATADQEIASNFPITMADIGVLTGDKEMALAQLQIAAQTASELTYGELLFNPTWDPLRGDPRFQKILESMKPASALPNK